MIPSR